MYQYSVKRFLRNSKAKPYQTRKGNEHLQEQHADDLTIFLEYVDGDDDLKALNIKNILNVLDEFFVLSDLGVNKAKTMLSLFGSTQDKPYLAGSLGIKWCTKFTLLGLDFDQNSKEMDQNLIKLWKECKK